ncbi:MAG: PKD domain-containing protein, partial [Planctomycetota bacterium]
YIWDFGDDQNGAGSTVIHTYIAKGVYEATLTVTDNEGASDTSSKKIVVLPILKRRKMDYEGFGTVTKGAKDSPEGYHIYHVTSLADDTRRPGILRPGTLRHALANDRRRPGTLRRAVLKAKPRLIVFDVGGTINLRRSLYIESRSYLIIDGSSAPSPGITISVPRNKNFVIKGPAHDIIINNIRVDGHGNANNVFGIYAWNMTKPVYNVIVDHCTFTSAGDAVFDTRGHVSNITYSWNLFKNTDYMGSFSDAGVRKGISFHHNVCAHGGERIPKIKNEDGGTTTKFDMVNNVVYGWNTYGRGWRGLHIQPYGWLLELHVTNNWYEPLTGREDSAIIISGTGHQVDFEGNVFPPAEVDDVDTAILPPPIPAWAQVTTYDARTLGDTVVPYVGTHYPTQEEQILLHEVSIAIGGQGGMCTSADVEPDQSVTDSDNSGDEQVTLDASGSSDPDGNIAN